MSAIRFPVEMPPPLRDAGESSVDTRPAYVPEKGVARRRQFARKTPRIFDVTYDVTQAQFQVFDRWWQYTILSGEKPFDTQLWDDLYGLTWFTVSVLQPYDASISRESDWQIRLKLLSVNETFGTTRPDDSSQMHGVARLGLRGNRGYAQSITLLHGSWASPLRARLTAPSKVMYGRALVGLRDVIGDVYEPPQPTTFPDSRQWIGMVWGRGVASDDVRLYQVAPATARDDIVSREWLRI